MIIHTEANQFTVTFESSDGIKVGVTPHDGYLYLHFTNLEGKMIAARNLWGNGVEIHYVEDHDPLLDMNLTQFIRCLEEHPSLVPVDPDYNRELIKEIKFAISKMQSL